MMTLSPGLRAGDDRVGVAYGLAEVYRNLMSYEAVALGGGGGDEDEGLSADERDGQHRNGGRGSGAPGDSGLDELAVAETLSAVWNLSLGENALQAVVDLRGEEGNDGFGEDVAGGIEDVDG